MKEKLAFLGVMHKRYFWKMYKLKLRSNRMLKSFVGVAKDDLFQ